MPSNSWLVPTVTTEHNSMAKPAAWQQQDAHGPIELTPFRHKVCLQHAAALLNMHAGVQPAYMAAQASPAALKKPRQLCAWSLPRLGLRALAVPSQDALGAQQEEQHNITLDQEYGEHSQQPPPRQWWEYLQHQGWQHSTAHRKQQYCSSSAYNVP